MLFGTIRNSTAIEIISALFILLFLYTALSKTINIVSTIDVLKVTVVFADYATEVAWGVVLVEYIVALLLLIPRTRETGLYASLGLMMSFTIYITYMMSVMPHLPCSCGGVISGMNWTEHLIFNICFILLAFTGILLEKRRRIINAA